MSGIDSACNSNLRLQELYPSFLSEISPCDVLPDWNLHGRSFALGRWLLRSAAGLCRFRILCPSSLAIFFRSCQPRDPATILGGGGSPKKIFLAPLPSPNSDPAHTLTLQPLVFWISLLFSFSDFPCFLGCFFFPSFSQEFRGSAKRTTLAFLGGVSLF